MTLQEIRELPVQSIIRDTAHLYLWVPNALLYGNLLVMKSQEFTYKTNLIWYKIRKDGGPDRRGVGFYFGFHVDVRLSRPSGKENRWLLPFPPMNVSSRMEPFSTSSPSVP